jgi:hypothetical protein
MKTKLKFLAGVFFLFALLNASGQVAHVQYEIVYNASGQYEAHAHVTGGSLVYPATIPFPSKFTVVVPASVNNQPFPVVQSVTPPGMAWSQNNSVYGPAASPSNDFHSFTIIGGGANNAYPVFTDGTDILLFKFTVPNSGYLSDLRCFINGTDPNSAQPGMNGIDFNQSFKTMNVERYAAGSTVKVSGYVAYNDNPDLKLNGVTVQLRNAANTLIGTSTTAANPLNGLPGYFAFSNIPDGSGYKLSGNYSATWGGNNSTDALIIQLNTIGTYPLAGLNAIVADVNASTTVSGLDALYVLMRTVGSVSAYPAGDWKISEQTFNLSGTPVTQNLSALCFGDVNASFSPGNSKETNFLSVIDDGVMVVSEGEEFIYQIRSNSKADVGAMTLFLGYDPNRFEVTGIASEYDGLKQVIGNGTVSVAWADTKSLSVNPGDVILNLKMKLKEKVSEPVRVFNVKSGSEFADNSARPYNDFRLKMAGVITPGQSNGISLFNYPNPFTYNSTIIYTLPEQGKVRLVLTDLYGKTLRTLTDRVQEAGTFLVKTDAEELNMAPGIYIYKLTFDGSAGTTVKSGKMIFTR